jgi:hypothetical protein
VQRPVTQDNACPAASQIHRQTKDGAAALPIAKTSTTRSDAETNCLAFLVMDAIPGHLPLLLSGPEAIVAIGPLPCIGKHNTARDGKIPL